MYSNILNAIFGKHWYASEEYMQAIVQIADNIFTSRDFFDQLKLQQQEAANEMLLADGREPVFLGRTGTYSNRIQLLENGTAVLPITGVIAPKLSAIGMCMAGTSMDMLIARSRELENNSDVSRVALHVNSGGGSVLGVPEATEALRRLARVKPVTAVYDHIGASAAFFLSSVAPKRVVTPSSILGSVGVYTVVATQAEKLEKAGIDARIIRAGKFKAMPNSIEPFADQEAGLALVQKDVDMHYNTFVKAIQENLNITMTEAQKLADGTVETGVNAIERGFASEEGTLEQVISGEIQSPVIGAEKTVIAASSSPAPNEPEANTEETIIVEEVEEPTVVAVEETTETIDDSAKEIAALKAKILLMESQAEESAKLVEETKAQSENEKIMALIETGLEDGRIVTQKADTITALALEMGLEKFTDLMASLPVPPVMEDLSTVPQGSVEAEEEVDEWAPKTERERAYFASIPELKKRYNL